MSTAGQLRNEVFTCEHCADLGAFKRSPDSGRFYKFPPTIGAQGEAELLFIGINPRRSRTNEDLHEWLIKSPEHFAKLAINRLHGGKPYIAANGAEEHYHCHMIVIEAVFGTGTAFEARAAVTELYMCASESGSALLERSESPCARLYMSKVIEIVQPRVIVAVGAGVRRHLANHFQAVIKAPVVPMIHPSELSRKSFAEKVERLQPTVVEVRERLASAGRK